jgi:hypothetical protein
MIKVHLGVEVGGWKLGGGVGGGIEMFGLKGPGTLVEGGILLVGRLEGGVKTPKGEKAGAMASTQAGLRSAFAPDRRALSEFGRSLYRRTQDGAFSILSLTFSGHPVEELTKILMVPRGGLAQPSEINDLSFGRTPRSSHGIIGLSAVGVQRQSSGGALHPFATCR